MVHLDSLSAIQLWLLGTIHLASDRRLDAPSLYSLCSPPAFLCRTRLASYSFPPFDDCASIPWTVITSHLHGHVSDAPIRFQVVSRHMPHSVHTNITLVYNVVTANHPSLQRRHS